MRPERGLSPRIALEHQTCGPGQRAVTLHAPGYPQPGARPADGADQGSRRGRGRRVSPGSRERRRETIRRLGLPTPPYILYVGTIEPRKNLDHLVECFGRLIRDERRVRTSSSPVVWAGTTTTCLPVRSPGARRPGAPCRLRRPAGPCPPCTRDPACSCTPRCRRARLPSARGDGLRRAGDRVSLLLARREPRRRHAELVPPTDAAALVGAMRRLLTDPQLGHSAASRARRARPCSFGTRRPAERSTAIGPLAPKSVSGDALGTVAGRPGSRTVHPRRGGTRTGPVPAVRRAPVERPALRAHGAQRSPQQPSRQHRAGAQTQQSLRWRDEPLAESRERAAVVEMCLACLRQAADDWMWCTTARSSAISRSPRARSARLTASSRTPVGSTYWELLAACTRCSPASRSVRRIGSAAAASPAPTRGRSSPNRCAWSSRSR